MALKTLSLPDGYIDRIYTIADTGDNTGYNHLSFLCGRRLEYGANNHDPTSPHDTALATKAIGSEEGNDCTNETSHIINRSNDALEVSVGVIEFFSKRRKANDGPQHPLVIAEELSKHFQSRVLTKYEG